MIEQTALEVTRWHYHDCSRPIGEEEHIASTTSLDVQRKRTSQKKGIACRFTSRFTFEGHTILDYIGEDSYVIDLEEVIDKNELLKMIRNSFEKYKEKFEFRKLSTILQNRSLKPLNESMINVDLILPLLI
ncbi:MAG: hypothetical protein ABJB11_16460 [Ferruginibacter sp.]